VKILDLSEIIPEKLLKKGIAMPHYEGWFEGNSITLKKRETRHFEPYYLPRAMVTFLNIYAALPPEQQRVMYRLLLDVEDGRECKLVDIAGETLLYFPDLRGDPDYDRFLHIKLTDEGTKTEPSPKQKGRGKKGKAGSG
jgi:hypothetical protein